MLFGLVALAIMLIGAVAMVRSMNTSLFNAGNLGFKRDLTNQGERAIAAVLTQLQTGSLVNEVSRQSSSTTLNYSASALPTNAQGLPTALITDSAFTTVGATSNDIPVTDQAVTVRYVVDRLCDTVGVASADQCVMAADPFPLSGPPSQTAIAEDTALGRRVIYRVSVRVTGPRNTQAYFQTTLTL